MRQWHCTSDACFLCLWHFFPSLCVNHQGTCSAGCRVSELKARGLRVMPFRSSSPSCAGPMEVKWWEVLDLKRLAFYMEVGARGS